MSDRSTPFVNGETILRPVGQSEPIGVFSDVEPGGGATSNLSTIAMVGQVLLGRFKLQEVIGRGGMGVVFRASDLHMQGEPVIAIKLLNDALRTNADADAALQRECRKVRMLAHDSIVRVFEFYRADEQAFITI